MELCEGGDLMSYIRKRRRVKEGAAKFLFKMLVSALEYLHEEKLILHRDIKPENILLDINGLIKLCDFGVSKQLSNKN